MDEQMVRKLVELERRQDTQELPEKSSDLISPFLALPALRGFWPLSSVDYTNPQARDIAAGGYHLTNNNTATFGYDPTQTLVPCVFLDGTNQYLSRADGGAANWADILGTEGYIENTAVSARGLTLGGWFWLDTTPGASGYGLMSKDVVAGNQRSYGLIALNTRAMRFHISNTGAAIVTTQTTSTTSTGAWFFTAGRFTPSTELKVWLGAAGGGLDSNTNVVAIPAAIFDSTSAFEIARYNAGQYLDGRASLCFLCAAALADATIDSVFQQTRGAFRI